MTVLLLYNRFLPSFVAGLIIAAVIRRLHVDKVFAGEIELPRSEAHHARDVLRLTVNSQVELFDDAGHTASAIIHEITEQRVVVRVDQVEVASQTAITMTIASAIPKGERADWMIEKLSELGVARFIPLITERSVVQASGKNKLDRWRRIAVESAKQSRRAGVMQVDEPTSLSDAIESLANVFALSTTPNAKSIAQISTSESIALLIGPEGGWTDVELSAFDRRAIGAVKLTGTVLRVETAAIAAAAIVGTMHAKG